MASTTRALILSFKPHQPPNPNPNPNPNPHHLYQHPFLSPPQPRPFSLLPSTTTTTITTVSTRRRVVGCLVSGVGGGGLSDTRKSEFSREFAVIANMLKRIEPLDSSDISKGVSDTAKDSMKQTISTMLGLLPSDQFSVSVRVSKLPLHRLLVSSIITGYTLWNAEYRMSLVRNFDLSWGIPDKQNFVEGSEASGSGCEVRELRSGEACVDDGLDGSDPISSLNLKDLSPEALSYIQQLEAELCSAEKELDAQKQRSTQIESNRGNNNNLLDYLRSLESDMVLELSQPSSLEVKEVIHELVQNTILRFFKDDVTSEAIRSTSIESVKDQEVGGSERCEVFTTSRDYLAKLLFWCMLLGHHLRGLENRLHLSCVVGLL